METIHLEMLTKETVRAMFSESQVQHAISFIDAPRRLDHVMILTGGLPRAVTALLQFVAVRGQHAVIDLDSDELHNFINMRCNSAAMQSAGHQALAKVLFEYAWAEVPFDIKTARIRGEYMAAVVARVGGYTTPVAGNPSLCVLVFPLFLFRAQPWSPRSLISISEYDNPGCQLEAAFRRILHLRLGNACVVTWSEVQLPFLDVVGIVTPGQSLHQLFAFSKITSAEADDTASAIRFMETVHSSSSDCQKQASPVFNLNIFCESMRIGQYYQPLAMSSTADAFIRCSERVMCQFQFKNFDIPINTNQILAEVPKCNLPADWASYLILVCSSGHCYNGDGSDMSFIHDGVTVVLLSASSVELFLGKRGLSSIACGETLLSDQTARVSISTPLNSAADMP
jgi:hypothetical protein